MGLPSRLLANGNSTTVQRLANVIMTSAMPSYPGVALDVMTGNITLHYGLRRTLQKRR